jgi:hypothetical protein
MDVDNSPEMLPEWTCVKCCGISSSIAMLGDVSPLDQ